ASPFLRTDKDIIYCQERTENRNIDTERHFDFAQEISARLAPMPIERRGKPSINVETQSQIILEFLNGMDIVIDGIITEAIIDMAEIEIGDDKFTVRLQAALNLGEFVALQFSHIFKDPASDDNIESLVVKLDFMLSNIELHQIWRGLVDSNIYPMV